MLSRSLLSALVAFAAAPRSSVAQLRLFNISGTVEGLSSSCVQVLNQEIACNPLLLELDPERFHTDDDIAAVCTDTCSSALPFFQRRVQGICGTSRYSGGDGWMYLTTFEVQAAIEAQRQICLRDSRGRVCNTVIRDDVVSADPEDGLFVNPPDPTALCNDCYLSNLKYRAEKTLGADDLAEDVLASLTSSCGSTTGYSITTPASTTTWSIRPSGAPTKPSCEGNEYTIRSGDTCESISFDQGINTNQLLRSNQLFAYCANFPTSGTVCIPEAWTCRPYRLRTGDTCRSISIRNQVSYAQLLTWNMDLGQYCENMESLAAEGFTVCLSNPGGTWEHPFPDDEPTLTETPIYVSAIEEGISMTTYSSRPSPTRDAMLPNLGYLDPLANGTRDDCFRYSGALVTVSNTNSTTTSECAGVAEAFDVTEDDLTAWNPDLLVTPGFDFPCELRYGRRYCVQRERIQASTLTEYCVRHSMALPGWECEDFLALIDTPLARFAEWNPDVGARCQNYRTGHMYCTEVQGFRPAGQISTCNRWATAESSDSETCGEIEARFNLQHARFVAWNPSVQQDCSGIVRGYEYCVGTPSFPAPTGA